jgi:mono/diheme cytochrome c family protein
MRRTFLAVILLIASVSRGGAVEIGNARHGESLATAMCAQCHAVRAGQLRSPDPMAPNFTSIATTLGMTAMALRVWLQSSHPSMPNYILTREQRNDVVAYIMSLKAEH